MSNIKNWKELPEDIDFDVIDDDQDGGNWSFGRGGRGLRDHQWSIEYVHPDLSSDVYVLSPTLSTMIDRARRMSSGGSIDSDKLQRLVEQKLYDSSERCEFKKAFIPEGWACVPIKKFAEELAKEVVREMGKGG